MKKKVGETPLTQDTVYLVAQVASYVNHYTNDASDWRDGRVGIQSAWDAKMSPINRRDMRKDHDVEFFFDGGAVKVSQRKDGSPELSYDIDSVDPKLHKVFQKHFGWALASWLR